MQRVDAVEQIIIYISELNKIVKYTNEMMKNCKIPEAVDAIHKFYMAYGTISAAIIMFHGTLTEDEIMKYHATLNQIAKEFGEETVKLAKKCRALPV